MEKNVLGALLDDREAYKQLQPYLEKEDFSEQGKIVLAHIGEFYDIDPEAKFVDRSIVIERIARAHPKHADVFANVISNLGGGSTKNLVYEYFELKKRTIGELLGSLLVSSSNKTKEIDELIESYKKLSESGTVEDEFETYVGLDIETIVDPLRAENLIKVYPKNLNDALDGGVPPGTHILVFARPECGKSAFVINMCAKFCMDGHKALYIGNEDPQSAMRMRFLNRFSGRDRHAVLQDPQTALDIAREKGSDNLVFVPMSPGTTGQVRRLAERHEPDIIVVDQVRNLGVGRGKQFTKVEQLEYVTKYMRDLNKEMGSVGVSVTQAGDSAEGKLLLEMNDIDFSNTGMQAHADVMMGIGMNREYEMSGRRMVSLNKNKISGIHEPFGISLIPTLSQVVSI